MSSLDLQSLGTMGVTEEQVDLLEVATNFCREKSPIETVRNLMEDDLGYDPGVWKEMGELGWLAIAIPEDYDGVGLSLTEVVPVIEQMGRRLLNSPFLSTTVAAQAVISAGTEAQKSDVLPKITTGSAATVALSEDHADWDLSHITCQAKPSGEGWALSGTKTFVMDLPSAAYVIVSVMRDNAPALIILNRDDIPDNAIRRETIIDETKRSYALNLDGLTIPESAFMDAAQISATLEHIHLTANLLSSAEMIGGTQAVIDYTVEYLGTRKQFGKLIGSYQSLKHTTVDAYVDYEKGRSLLYAAAFSFGEQGKGEIATRMAKAKADKALSFASDRAIQFHGGFGFTYDCNAQLYRRRAIFHASQYGDARYHKAKLAELLF